MSRAATHLRRAFEDSLQSFLNSSVIRHVASGKLTTAEYASVLREIYFYSREDPQLQAFATAWFKGADRALVRLFLKHAIAEVGHDQLALNDLTALGYDATLLRSGFPLPTTIALTSFPYWAVQFLSPVSYLGYLYFLEALPTTAGGDLIAALESAGIPGETMSFLREHATVDVAHIKLMGRYVSSLVQTEADQNAVE